LLTRHGASKGVSNLSDGTPCVQVVSRRWLLPFAGIIQIRFKGISHPITIWQSGPLAFYIVRFVLQQITISLLVDWKREV